MKANAPERIWIDPATDLPKLSGHIDKDSVEYIRIDAFIEKACEFWKDHLAGYDIFEDDIERSVESFKLAMRL